MFDLDYKCPICGRKKDVLMWKYCDFADCKKKRSVIFSRKYRLRYKHKKTV